MSIGSDDDGVTDVHNGLERAMTLQHMPYMLRHNATVIFGSSLEAKNAERLKHTPFVVCPQTESKL